MTFVWSKRGWVVPVAFFAAIFAGGVIGRALGQQYADDEPHWPVRAATLLAAFLVLGLGRHWNRRRDLLVWDARRERLTYLPAGHTFFWLDVQVWGWILIAGWIWALFFPF
jgi:hypothetical protein